MKKSEFRQLVREEVAKVLATEGAANAKYKVGDEVMVTDGPMKSVAHKVIAVIQGIDGTITYNVQPILKQGIKNMYRLGAAGATEDQLMPAN